MAGDPALIDFIKARILRNGPVPFRWFMEQALYHPMHGYYAAGKAAIGRRGDYFTNVSVGPLFGRLLAGQFRKMWQRMGQPALFIIVEQGANNGDFARDVLAALQSAAPDFFAAVKYRIVEPFPVLQKRQRQTLASFSQVEWHSSLADLPPFHGVHFSNELVDAMPVHLVKYTGGAWKERHVDWKNNRFEFLDAPLSSPKLADHLKKLPHITIENYTTEINLDALDWIDSLAARLESGYALITDYGWPRDSFYAPDRVTGTLTCYSQHQRSYDPLQNAGNSDITAHVDFTTLAGRAEASGFRLAGFADQHHFMVGLGKQEFPDTDQPADPARMKSLRAFHTLMHPALMGLAFKFLALEKNLEKQSPTPLAGFQFSSNPKAALGI